MCTAPVFEPIVIDLPGDTTFAQNAPITTWTFPFLTYTEGGVTTEGQGTGGTGTARNRAFHILESGRISSRGGEFESGHVDSEGNFQAGSVLDLPEGLACGRLGALTTACDARDPDDAQSAHEDSVRAPVLSGTPTETGTWLMRYSIIDTANRHDEGGTVRQTFNLVVVAGPVFGPGAQIDDDTHSYAAGTPITSATLAQAASSVGGVTYRLTGPSGEAVGNDVTTGLSFDANTRVLSGTPTVAGTIRLTYTATDANGDEDQQDFRLVVTGPQLVSVATQTYSIGTEITALELPEATGVGSLTPVTYSLTDSEGQTVDEAIPGLSFDAATRMLSGTPATEAGTVVLTYTARDSNNSPGEQVFSVVLVGPEFPTLAGRNWSAGTAVSVTLDTAVVTGTTTVYARPVTYSLTDPDGRTVDVAVPGVAFDPNTRILSGTPTAVGDVRLTYTATDDLGNTGTGNFFVSVGGPTFLGQSQRTVLPEFPASVAITSTALHLATQSDGTTAYGAAVTYTLVNSDGQTVDEAIPGLRFDENTRMLSGTPTTPGRYTFIYSGTDIYGNPVQTFDREGLVTYYYVITVTGPQLAAVADQSGSAGSAVTATALPEATGSTPEAVYSLTGPDGAALGDAVPGLVFDPDSASRELSGTPTVVGTTTLTYRVEDMAGNGDTEIFTFTVTGPTLAQQGTSGVVMSGGAGLALTPVVLTTATQSDGTTAYGAPLTYSLADSDGEPVEAAVPGLVFDPATRELRGTATRTGTTTLTYTATDSEGNTGMTVFDLVVPGAALTLPTSITGTMPADSISFTVGTALTQGTTELTFVRPGTGVFRPEAQTMRLAGGVPDGLEFDPVSGVLSGTPVVAGTTTLTWEVEDLYENIATSVFTVIVDGITFTAAATRTYTVGTALTATSTNTLPQAMLGTSLQGEDAVLYEISALPPGVSFAESTRILSGTPTAPTTGTRVVYSATDSSGNTVAQTFTITVDGLTLGPLTNATRTCPAGVGATSSSCTNGVQLAAANNIAGLTVTYAVTSVEDRHGNRVPLAEAVPGLSFNAGATSRTLGGTPTVTGTTSLLYSATDNYGNRATTGLTVVIDTGPTLAQGDLTFTFGGALTPTTLAAATAAGGSTDAELAISTYSLTGADSTPLGTAVPGLSFDDAPDMRVLSGTPTTTGTTLLTYTATDASGNVVTDTFTVTVNGPTLGTTVAAITLTAGVAITDTATTTLPEATNVHSSLTATYAVTGAEDASLDDAVPGLTFTPATRVLSGTPTTTGTTILTYSASVSTAGDTFTGTQAFTVTVDGLAIMDPTNLTPTVGTEITTVTLEAATPASTLTPLVYAVVDADGTAVDGTPGSPVPGLSFDATATVRELSGTPTRAGTTTLTYTVTDSEGNVSSQDFTVTVGGGVTLAALTNATRNYPVGVALSSNVELAAASGSTMVTYAVEDADGTAVDGTPAGSAVPGLSFNADATVRALSGTPTEVGTYPLIYSATDENGNRATTPLTVVVDGPALATVADQTATLGTVITSITLSAVTRGSTTLTEATDAVTYTLQNSDGLNVDATATTGNAVPGLVFDPATRILSGTPSAAGGVTVLTYSATVTAPCTASVDSCTATTTFSVTVAEPVLNAVIADMTYEAGTTLATPLTLPELINVDSGVTVNYTLQNSDGLNVDATATTGNAVPGLVFDPTNRQLSGTPTGENGVFSLTYTATTVTSGTVTAAYTLTQTFTVTVVGGPTLAVVDDQTYPLGGAITTLPLSAASSASGFTGVAYTLQDSNGDDVDATDNAVPGLVFDPSNRELTGTPTTPGATALTYAVTGVGGYSVPPRIFTVTVSGPTLSTDDRSFPASTTITGAATLTTLDEVTGIDSGLTVTYALTGPSAAALGTAVPGLSFAPTTRVLSGTPTTLGATVLNYTAAITATADVAVATTVTTTLTFTVTGPALGPLGLATRTYPVGVSVSSNTLLGTATGVDTTMVTYAVANAGGTAVDGMPGSAVPGLSFDPATRVLSGTPTVAGTYPLIYSATDPLGVATTPLTLVVTGPSFGTTTFADQAYTQDAAGTATALPVLPGSSTLTPVTYTVTGPDGEALGTAVPGLTFNGDAATRELGGTPTVTGTFQLTYTATDSSGNSGSLVFGVTVNPPLAFDPSIAVADTYTYPTSQALTPLVLPFASGGTGTITYGVSGPSGAVLSSLTFEPDATLRTLTGTPTTTTTGIVLTYTATDEQSAVATISFTVVVTDSALFLSGADDQTYSVGVMIPPLTLPGTNLTPEAKTYTLTGPGQLALGTAVPGLTFTQAAAPSATNAGTLSGTPTAAGTTELTYTATESGADIDSFTFTVTVTDAPVFRAGQVDRSYSVGEAVSLTLPEAESGTTPTYTLEPLPDGLIFDSVPRRLHGRPVAPGTTELVYTATAGGADTTLTFSVTVSGLTFASTPPDQNVSVGAAITTVTLPGASGVSGSVTYALTGPDAMELDTAVPGLAFTQTDPATITDAGTLSGTPTVVGTTVLTYTATDAYGNTEVETFRVAVAGMVFEEEVVANPFYPVGVVIEELELPEVQGAGSGSLTYTLRDSEDNDVDVTDNGVPGLTFAAGTRILSGTPTATGTFALTYAVTGAGITTGTVTPLTFFVVVTGGPAFLDTMPDQEYAPGAQIPAIQLPAAAGGSGALTYKLTGVDAAQEIDADGNDMTEVPGLRFDPAVRQMSGTMGAATVLTYTVTDAGGNTSSQMFALRQLPVGAFVDAVSDQLYADADRPIPSLTLPAVRLLSATRQDAENEDATVTYSLTGPNGMDLSEVGLDFAPVSRVLSGTPVGLAEDSRGKTYLLTYTATDGDGNVVGVRNFGIRLVPLLQLDITDLDQFPATYPAGRPISPVEFPEATGQSYGNLIYSFISSSGRLGTGLPPGLFFDPNTRMLTGTPLESDRTFGMVYRVCDSAIMNVCTVTGTFDITIMPTPYFGNAVVATTTYSVGTDAAAVATGLNLPDALPTGPAYEYDLYPLPDGLTFRSNALFGTLTTAGTTALTYTATHPDTLVTTAPLTFTLEVVDGPVLSSEVGNQGFAKDAAITSLTLPEADYSGSGTLAYSLSDSAGTALDGTAASAVPGLTFAAGTRILSGTPTENGATVLTYIAGDGDGETPDAMQIFTVVVRDAGENDRPEIRSGPSQRVTGTPRGTEEVDVSVHFMDSDGDPLSYSSCVLVRASGGSGEVCAGSPDADRGANPLVSVVRQDGDMLTLYFGPLVGFDSDPTKVRVTASDAFGASARQLLFAVFVREAPVLNQIFADVTLTVDSGETTYLDVTGNTLDLYFRSDRSETESVAYRFSASSENEAVASVRVGTDLLTINTSLTLIPKGCVGTTEITVRAEDSEGQSAEGTFDLTVRDPDGVAPACVDSEGPMGPMGPMLSEPFEDVTLYVGSGETTYQEETETNNRLCAYFRTGDGEPCSEDYRFSVSVADEEIASARVGTETLTTNTSLTLTPIATGTTTVTVTVTDMDNRSIPGTFTLTVVSPPLAPINRVILPEVARAVAGHVVDAIARRMEQAREGIATAGTIGGQTSLASALAAHGEAMQEGTRSLENLLGDSNFALSLGGGDGEAGTSSATLWGGGDYRNLSGDSEGTKFDGDVLSVHLGADTRLREDVLAGLMVSRSRSDLEYESAFHNGDHEVTVTNVSPYVGWSALDGAMDLWASASYGTGELEMSYGEDGSAQASSDVEMRSLAAGLSGRVMEFEAGGTLRVKGDALQTTLELDGDDGDLERGSYDANRLRVSAEASLSRATDSGARLEPSVEAGIRHDGGDGKTGNGIELNVGLRHTQPASGITLEGGAYTLVGRDDYKEWGVNGQFRIAAGTAGRGLSLNLSPSYGKTPSGLQKVWQQDTIERGANVSDASMRVDTRLGYGLSALGGQGLLTPYSEITFEETNTYRLGVRWNAGSILRLDLAGATRDGSAEHEILLKAEVLF